MIIFDLSIEQGSTFEQLISLNEDLTGHTISSDIKDSTGVITSNIATIADENYGAIRMFVTAGNTSAMSIGVGYYDIEITETSSGKVTKPMKGRVIITGEVTK